jgi:hypothetical protein
MIVLFAFAGIRVSEFLSKNENGWQFAAKHL